MKLLPYSNYIEMLLEIAGYCGEGRKKIPKITEKSPGLPWSETIMYGHKLSTVKGRAKLQPSKSVMSAGGGECPGPQVWSLTQLYSFDFS